MFVLDSRRKSHNRLLISFSTGSWRHASLVQSLPPISSPLQCLFCLDFIFKSCLFSEQMVYGINCPLLNKIHVEFSYKLQVRRKTTNGLSSLVYVYSLQCYAFLPRVMWDDWYHSHICLIIQSYRQLAVSIKTGNRLNQQAWHCLNARNPEALKLTN